MTSRPSPAKTMLAEVVPRKNFPRRVPVESQTYKIIRKLHTASKLARTYLYAIPTATIHISIRIDLYSIRNTCISIGKDPTVFECVSDGIDIKCVTEQGDKKMLTLKPVRSDHLLQYLYPFCDGINA
jgi:hypothetical protein